MKKSTLIKAILIASLLAFSALAQAVTITASSITPANGLTNTGGAINISVSNGSGSYKYQWSNQATTESISNLSAGNYTVTVNDNGANYSTATFTVGYTNESFDLIANTSLSKCKTSSRDIITQTNSSIVSYVWSTNATTSAILATDAGTYYVTASFASGLQVVDSITISNIVVNKPTTIYGDNSVLVNASKIYAIQPPVSGYSYKFSILGGKGSMIATPGSVTSGSATWGAVAGVDYVVCEVFTPEQCSDTTMLKVTINDNVVTPVSISGIVTPANGITNTAGAINITVTGGSGFYKYNWSNKATTEDLTALAAGNYTVTVNDNGATYTTATFTVGYTKESFDLIANTSLSKCKTSSRDIMTQTNSSIVSYIWSTKATTANILATDAGTYYVTASFASGLQVVDSITITNIVVNKPTTIYGDKSVLVNSSKIYAIQPPVSGYSYKFSILGGKGSMIATPGSVTSGSATWGAVAGVDYVVCEVFTPEQCSDTTMLKVTINDNVVTPVSISGIVTPANGITNTAGSINITVTGGSGSFKYNWSNQATTEDITALAAGNYTVTVNDTGATYTTATFTVGYTKESFDLIANTSLSKCKTSSRDIMTQANSSIVSYIWSTKATTANILATDAGTYYVTASFASGLQVVDSITITNIVVNKPTTIYGDKSVLVNSSKIYA